MVDKVDFRILKLLMENILIPCMNDFDSIFPKIGLRSKKLETSNITAYVTTLSIQCTSLKPGSTASSRPWKIAVNYFIIDFVKIGDEDTLSWMLWNFEFNFDCNTQKKDDIIALYCSNKQDFKYKFYFFYDKISTDSAKISKKSATWRVQVHLSHPPGYRPGGFTNPYLSHWGGFH